jgi:Tc5 transposase DNA-binding domain
MAQMDQAIAYLKAQDAPNYAGAARIYDVQPTTLRRRFLGLATSRAVASAEHHQLLNTAQEEVLLGYIDRMTARHIPLTPQIVQNLATELLGRPPGKNWPAAFVKRHKERICSRYLHPLDRLRCSAEKPALFEQFYVTVLYFFTVFKILTDKMIALTGHF